MSLVSSPEVAAAQRPLVALESTLIAHGLPWPENLKVGRELEATVRTGGAVPATIAILDGTIHVGLTDDELERLARDPEVKKGSATDVAVFLARKTSAATTVSATAMIAHRAGIRVFATGGIGGVHRGAASDVSHDLVALARTPIAVISAGAKAILDLPRTLEALETLGVLVIGWKTSELPAFYSRHSGLPLEHRVDSARELAAIAHHHWQLGGGGILVANPVPEIAEAPELAGAIDLALDEAETAGVTGKQLTPFLLSRIAVLTEGKSVLANRALAVHNASVAAELACALARIEEG